MSAASALLVALAAAGLGLLVLAGRTARPPAGRIPTRDGYFATWQVLHGDYDPLTGSAWLRGWLSMVYLLARPLARRGVQPDVVTVTSAWLTGLVVVLAALGGGWLVAAGALVVASGLFDNLDGALAVLQERTTRWGYVLDSAVDRVNDSLYLVAVVVAGCPAWLAVGTGFAVFLLEYLRARAGNAGGDEVGMVTMAERPTRVLLLAPTLLVAGLVPDVAGVATVVGPAVLLVMTAISVGQLGVTIRRQLLALPPG